MKHYVKILLLLSVFCYLPFSGFAWGSLGHRIVGQIAEGYLSKKAKREVYKILGTESMAITSTWPDFIKADSVYNYLSPWH